MMKRLMLTTVGLGALILATPALSADLAYPMPYKAPGPVPIPYYSWTGCYLGGHVGGGWGRKDFSVPGVSVDTDGFLGGGQIGCNYQFAGQWVVGIEADASWADISGNAANP